MNEKYFATIISDNNNKKGGKKKTILKGSETKTDLVYLNDLPLLNIFSFALSCDLISSPSFNDRAIPGQKPNALFSGD